MNKRPLPYPRPCLWLPLVVATTCGLLWPGLRGLAQPTVPRPAPVPPRIVPGGGNAPERIKPNVGAEKIQITPRSDSAKVEVPSSTISQKVVAPSPFKLPGEARVEPAELNAAKPQTNRFVVALCADQKGRLWVGTEGEGVWCYDEKATDPRRWTRFTSREGLGDDNAYVIACDKEGRIWVGHLNHGVSVYNGQQWKNYDVLDGPLGERIFDIAVAPNDGSVWMATSAGLTRYSTQKDEWSYFTRAEGLPSDQIAALAFNSKGDLFAGTQCDGLAIACATEGYKTWQRVRAGKPRKGASGQGLPSDLINDVLITKGGLIYVATSRGLAFSNDGNVWRYLRGRDWKGFQNFQEVILASAPTFNVSADALLREDWVNALGENPTNGHLFIGYRQKGWEDRTIQTNGALGEDAGSRFYEGLDDVRSILPLGEKITVGFYGGGTRLLVSNKLDTLFQLPDVAVKAAPAPIDVAPPVQKIIPTAITITAAADIVPKVPRDAVPLDAVPPEAPKPSTESPKEKAVVKETVPFPALPAVARPPSITEMRELLQQVMAIPVTENPVAENLVTEIPGANNGKIEILPLNDDWRTQGDCLDRYGRQSGVFCAINGGGNNARRGYWDAFVWHRGWIGSNHSKGDELRYWIGTLWTDDRRALQYPVHGRRRFAEHDDHGETYPASQDGPHIYETLRIPKGRSLLSLYFVNDDGHGGPNRWRDYTVDVRPTPMTENLFNILDGVGVNTRPVEAVFDKAPLSARSRVGQFWGGVYKRFYVSVNQPTYITIKINRNHSFNTILSGIFLDPVGEFGMIGYNPQPAVPRKPLNFTNDKIPAGTKADASIRLMDRILALRDTNPTWYALHSRPYLLALLRCLLNRDRGGSFLAKNIELSESYPNLRRDVASCFNSIQQFDKRDQVFYDPFNQVTWDWVRVTPLNRKFNGDIPKINQVNQWDREGFDRFIAEQKARQSWP